MSCISTTGCGTPCATSHNSCTCTGCSARAVEALNSCTDWQSVCLCTMATRLTGSAWVAGTKATSTGYTCGMATPAPFEEAGGSGPSPLGEDVACWPFPALRPPAGNKGEETSRHATRGTCPGGRDKVSTTTLLSPGMCLILLVHSATYARCRHCRAVHGLDTRETTWVSDLWSVNTVNLRPSTMCRKCLMPA
jgi:hypothetical protein